MNVRGDQWKQPNPPERRTDKPAAVPGAARAIAMRTIRLALGDATLSKCNDIGTMDARPKRTPRPGGQSAGPSGTGGFAIDSPRRVNLSSFKARQLDDEKPPESGLLNNGSRSRSGIEGVAVQRCSREVYTAHCVDIVSSNRAAKSHRPRGRTGALKRDCAPV